jgi:soluble lytic murein transglycosylase
VIRALALAAALAVTAPAAGPEARGVEWDAVRAAIRWDSALVLEPSAGAGAGILASDSSCAGPPARLALAEAALALADTSLAQRILADSALAAGPWAWDAMRRGAELRLARADTAGAAAILGAPIAGGWPDDERASRHAMRAALALSLRDTAGAEDLARGTLRLFPALPPAEDAVAILARLATARGRALDPADERLAAESEASRRRPARALERIARLREAAAGEARARLWLRTAELLRSTRRGREGVAAADSALRIAPAALRGAALLERARQRRELGLIDSAFADFALAARAGEAAPAFQAGWESGRMAEARGRYREGAASYAMAAAAPHRRAGEAWTRAGLLWLAAGESDSARACWTRGVDEASRFWLGVTLRALDRPRADSLLRSVATVPGYTFYRAAARDTLGVRGAPAGVRPWAGGAAVTRGDSAAAETVALASCSGAEGATRLLSRLLAGDPRVLPAAAAPGSGTWIASARIAYRAGRPRLATVLAERALAAAEEAGDSLRWSLVPWIYPPAYERWIEAGPDSLEPALLYALIRQESRFDSAARSSSDALGLAQLKRDTAGDVARWLREAVPTETDLLRPERSIRYGARYLRWLLGRFDRNLAVALSAYNAGPGTIPRRWKDVVARGGDALWCELAPYPESQEYARRILMMRQAYRELSPRTTP